MFAGDSLLLFTYMYIDNRSQLKRIFSCTIIQVLIKSRKQDEMRKESRRSAEPFIRRIAIYPGQWPKQRAP